MQCCRALQPTAGCVVLLPTHPTQRTFPALVNLFSLEELVPFLTPPAQATVGLSYREVISRHGSGCVQSRVYSGFAIRPFTASAPLWEDASKRASENGSRAKQSLGIAQREARDDITDQIPDIKRPMGVVEGTSYTVLIVAGLAFAGRERPCRVHPSV